MKLFYIRIRFFLSVIWRPVTGPCGNEPAMTEWQIWRAYGISVRTAYEMASTISGRTL